MIRLTRITKRFGKKTAVDGLNLHIPAGEIFGCIGPNGAGKTTTIRMMAGLMAPTEGEVVIDGISMAKTPEAAKARIGLIPDRPFLYDKLTGMEFLRFTADLHGMNGVQFRQRAEALLSKFNLLDRSQELIGSYSHGMKQRLIMAAALLHEPPILIVDEPMVGLDPRGIHMVRTLFHTLAQKGVTIFMSTHTLKLAEDLCHRIGILHKGSLVATGSVETLTQAARTDGGLEAAFMALTEENAAS